jgi:hypothetical protein
MTAHTSHPTACRQQCGVTSALMKKNLRSSVLTCLPWVHPLRYMSASRHEQLAPIIKAMNFLVCDIHTMFDLMSHTCVCRLGHTSQGTVLHAVCNNFTVQCVDAPSRPSKALSSLQCTA